MWRGEGGGITNYAALIEILHLNAFLSELSLCLAAYFFFIIFCCLVVRLVDGTHALAISPVRCEKVVRITKYQ